jgi:uncharacterized protein YjiK
MFMPLLLPDVTYVFTQSGGLLPVMEWAGFSEDFIAGLVPVERDGVTYWPVWVMEDAGVNPRRRLILNANDQIIAELPVPKDYDPAWWVQEHYPQLYEATTTASAADYRSDMEALFDGSRLVMQYDLIDHDNLVKLVLKHAIEAAARAEEEGGGMMMMGWEGSGLTNLQFVEIALLDTNGILSVTVGRPDDYTNRISLIACTNLLDPAWSLLLTTNSPTTTNTFTYIDTDATNDAGRFYHAYNADYDGDGDGVSDGEERFLDGTDPEDPDDPPNVKGTVSYAGIQEGTIYVIAVTSSGSWSTNASDALSAPGAYIIPKLDSDDYYIKAWLDVDDDGALDTNEARVEYAGNPITVAGQVTNINLTLADVDSDTDGLPDWWEDEHFGTLARTATDDEDEDALSNLAEYLFGADPNDADTDNDGMGDTAEVAHGMPPATSNDFAALPYSETFEALSEGYLNNQSGWVCAPTDAVVVQTNEVNGGSQAAEFLAATVTPTADQFIAAQGETNVWIDFRAKIDPRAITYFDDHPDIDDAPAYEPCVFAVNRRGEVWAYDGAQGAWTNDARFILTEYQWHRFTVRENYNDHTWDLFVDSIRVFAGLGFREYLPDLWPRDIAQATATASNTDLGGFSADGSGCAVMPSTGELLVIENGDEDIYVYDLDGNYQNRSINLTDFDDTEGICHVEGDTFAIVEERISEITLVTITSNTTTIAKASGQTWNMNIADADNLGIEGITYNPNAGVFYVVKEKTPMKLYQVELAADGVAYATELFDVSTGLGGKFTDLSDVYFDAVSEHLYLLSDESNKIVQTTLGGTVVGEKAVSGGQPEGLTIAADRRTVFVISEPDDFYRYRIDPQSGDYVDITEFSRFTVAAARGGGGYVADSSVGTSQPSGLYGALQTTNKIVAANADDAEENAATHAVSTGGDLDIGYDDADTQIVGIRFVNLGIANGAAIHAAHIQFTEKADSAKDEVCGVKIEGQNADNAAIFSETASNISSRPRTTAFVDWSLPGWRQTGEASHRQQTPDVSAIVRAVVTRGGWQTNNGLAFIISHTTTAGNQQREALDYDGTANPGPVLQVEWAAPLP